MKLQLAFILVTGLIDTTYAGAQPVESTRLLIPRVRRVPQLSDFASMEVSEAPAGMRKIEGLVQRSPNDGAPVTERTVAYIGFDDDSLYVVFLSFDRERTGVRAHLTGRDLQPGDDDAVAVYVDTFRDLRHAYGFLSNPLGVQMDGFYTEGTGWDLSWDSTWHSEALQTDTGYVVLIGIPFRSLRFPATDRQQWGLFLFRFIGRRNEGAYWPACSSRLAARFPQAAIVDLPEPVSPGRNFQAIPYLSSRSFKALATSPGSPPAFVRKQADSALGIDAKAVIRDSIVVDATINPDFSQVESDQPQITVNKPFEVFFPEKRPFFLENAAYFDTPINLLFTRRIANPRYGGRATGRIGAYSVGALIIDDESPFDAGSVLDPHAWSLAGRVMRDVGQQSHIGAFASTRRGNVTENDVGALDGRFRLGPNWFVTGQSAVSRTRSLGMQSLSGAAWIAAIAGSGRRFAYQLLASQKDPGFRVTNGFVPRVGIRSVDQRYSFSVRRGRGTLQSWGPTVRANRTWDENGRPLDWFVTPGVTFDWSGATSLEVYYTAGTQTLRAVEVPTVTHDIKSPDDRVGVNFSTAMSSRVSLTTGVFAGKGRNLSPAPGVTPQLGDLLDATTSVSLRVSPSLTIDGSALFDRLSAADSGRRVYASRIGRLRVGQFFTRALWLRAIIQYSELDPDRDVTDLKPERSVNYDLLLGYLRSPGTGVYVGANYNLASLDTGFALSTTGRRTALHNDGWQVFTKVSYLIRR